MRESGRFLSPQLGRKVFKDILELGVSLVFLGMAVALGAGGENVVIKEWDVPTPHSRPHDPAVAPDGSLWYTGQMANKLGRLDPQTGQFREYPLKTPESGPHGIVADRDGNIWFTAVFKGYVGKLNPATGEITEYHMPDARATDPHTPAFDQQGVLWFTLEESLAESEEGRLLIKENTLPSGTYPTLSGSARVQTGGRVCGPAVRLAAIHPR